MFKCIYLLSQTFLLIYMHTFTHTNMFTLHLFEWALSHIHSHTRYSGDLYTHTHTFTYTCELSLTQRGIFSYIHLHVIIVTLNRKLTNSNTEVHLHSLTHTYIHAFTQIKSNVNKIIPPNLLTHSLNRNMLICVFILTNTLLQISTHKYSLKIQIHTQ